jgi:hypothetical protein
LRGKDVATVAAKIRALKPATLWRFNVAGDLPGIGEEIDGALAALASHGRAFSLSASLANGDRLDARGARVNGTGGRLLGHALWLDDAAAARVRGTAPRASLGHRRRLVARRHVREEGAPEEAAHVDVQQAVLQAVLQQHLYTVEVGVGLLFMLVVGQLLQLIQAVEVVAELLQLA